ncbi:MAG TPA: hypothetical protein VHO67_04720 [Polyangia bacterium]|nr:hypothetical protein [Polyangia bacterium]
MALLLEAMEKPRVVAASDAAFRAWVNCHGLAAKLETGGIIPESVDYDDRVWLSLAKVTRAQVDAAVAEGLLEVSDRNIRVVDYDRDGEFKYTDARKRARENGARGGRPKKSETEPVRQPSGIPESNPVGLQHETQTEPAEKLSSSSSSSPFPEDPPPPASARSNGDARPAMYQLPAGPVTSYTLTRLFGFIRSRDVGGLEWQGARITNGKDTDMAELINSDPSLRADVVPTMELLFRRAKEGREGKRSADILREPSFGFAVWCSSWTSLREELHGKRPAVPKPAQPNPLCAFHRQGFRGRLPREGAHDGCPECKHAQAAAGKRSGDPATVRDALAATTERHLAKMRQAAEKAATPDEIKRAREEFEAEQRQPAKAVAS